MFVLCWTSCEVDGWDILKSAEEVTERVQELMKKGFSNEDMMVFTQREYLVPDENGKI